MERQNAWNAVSKAKKQRVRSAGGGFLRLLVSKATGSLGPPGREEVALSESESGESDEGDGGESDASDDEWTEGTLR